MADELNSVELSNTIPTVNGAHNNRQPGEIRSRSGVESCLRMNWKSALEISSGNHKNHNCQSTVSVFQLRFREDLSSFPSERQTCQRRTYRNRTYWKRTCQRKTCQRRTYRNRTCEQSARSYSNHKSRQ